jgi:hypothetical protein
MRRTILLVLAGIPLLPMACTSPYEETLLAPPEAPPPAPAESAPPQLVGPAHQVALLVGGEPATHVPTEALVALGEDAIAYMTTCREREHKAGQDPQAWATAQGAPVCVAVHFVPPLPLASPAGVQLDVEELLLPLGAPRWDGVVLARETDAPWAALIAGDRVILDRLRAKAQGALSAVVVAQR